MTEETPTIMMVYNADAGVFNAMSDAFHKAVSPDTYQCSLCVVTHGIVSMRFQWRTFLGSLPLKKKFCHRDDFADDFPGVHVALPAILLDVADSKPKVLVSQEELSSIDDLSKLIMLTEQRLASAMAQP